MPASENPQNLSKTAWYYEYPKYIIVVAELRDASGAYLGTAETKIPVDRLKASINRMRRPAKIRPRLTKGKK